MTIKKEKPIKIKPHIRGAKSEMIALSLNEVELSKIGYCLYLAIAVHNPYQNGPVWSEVWRSVNGQDKVVTLVRRSNVYDLYIE